LPWAAAVSAAAMFALLACAHWQGPDWLLLVLAALVGALPSMPAMVRARWTVLLRGTPQLQTAYALEAVLDDVCFIVGPPLSVGLSMVLFPEAGPLAASLLLLVGVALFMLAQGIIVGTIDVASVAFATQQGQPAAASIVLSFYALGSCVMGLVFGTLRLKAPLHRQIAWVGASVCITAVPLLLATNVFTLTLAVLLAGITFGPTITVAMGLVEQQVPHQRLTEGMTWLLTGIAMGVALGAAAAGWATDLWGARISFVVALLAGVAMWALGVLAARQARAKESPPAEDAAAACT
ncbi:MAG: MFS transporter, partial [Delftia acidovorans]|nr:MFS transporter [Delftia acidovorans]